MRNRRSTPNRSTSAWRRLRDKIADATLDGLLRLLLLLCLVTSTSIVYAVIGHPITLDTLL